jgi:pilus retraction protein PilT
MAELIDELAQRAFAAGATDLFLYEDKPPRMRINGEVGDTEDEALDFTTLTQFWLRCGCDPGQNQERDVSYLVPGGHRLRVNLYKSLGQLAAVLRPIKDEIPGFAELGLPEELFSGWLERRSGLVLVTGPTGSGKSTSLASCLQWINQHYQRHVVTIEDPVEYLFRDEKSYFSQREIRSDTESFAVALRASLRQSPDVIFLGEIRDEESALISLQAAETGHLVLATLHSSGVTDTMERLTNMFTPVQRDSALALLSAHLIGVFSQQLLPRTDGGLFLAIEHLHNQAATRNWIRDRKYEEIADHLNRSDSSQNCSFLRYLVAATQQDIIAPDTARNACPNPQDFDRSLRGIS